MHAIATGFILKRQTTSCNSRTVHAGVYQFDPLRQRGFTRTPQFISLTFTRLCTCFNCLQQTFTIDGSFSASSFCSYKYSRTLRMYEFCLPSYKERVASIAVQLRFAQKDDIKGGTYCIQLLKWYLRSHLRKYKLGGVLACLHERAS